MRPLASPSLPYPRAGHVCSPACQHKPGKYRGWAATSVRGILTNEIYAGVVIYRGKRLDVKVPRIISPELLERARGQMERTRRAFSGKRSADGRLSGRPEARSVSICSAACLYAAAAGAR